MRTSLFVRPGKKKRNYMRSTCLRAAAIPAPCIVCILHEVQSILPGVCVGGSMDDVDYMYVLKRNVFT